MSLDAIITLLMSGAVAAGCVALIRANRPTIDAHTRYEAYLTRAELIESGIAEQAARFMQQQPKPPPLPETPMHILVTGPAAEDKPCAHENTAEIRDLCDPIGICYCTDGGKDVTP